MRLKLGGIFGCVLILVATWAATGQGPPQASSQPKSPAGGDPPSATAAATARDAARRIVEQTNAFRAEQELPAVADNSPLRAAAEYFANFMAQNEKYGHTADGQQPSDRARDQGYEPCMVAENIGWQRSRRAPAASELADRFVEGWKPSDEHRRNMLDADVTEIGVAVAASEKSGEYYAVQMFGRPKSLSLHVILANRAGKTIEYDLDDRRFSLPAEYIRTHELCRPAELTLHDPDRGEEDEGQTTSIKADGNYAVVRDPDGRLRLKDDRAYSAQQRPLRR